ncbi:MAG: hypothetical protein L6E13_10855 [Firmicutes bacterium]|nr:hypothetical protein [Bacillota bacterium]
MTVWAIRQVRFDGYAPEHSDAAATAWQFTATAGERHYSVYLQVANRVLRQFGRIPPQSPPPPELVPRLEAYVKRRLEQPWVYERHPQSLAGVILTLTTRAEWQELMEG